MSRGKVIDGRVKRGNRTKEAIVDALLALIDEGNLRPGTREIAERAKVSVRTLYVHFEDVEALFHAAATHHRDRLGRLCEPLVTTGTFEERLDAYLNHIATRAEVGTNVLQAALLQEPFSEAMRVIVEESRRAEKAELATIFAPELRVHPANQKLAALDVCTNMMAWRALRTNHRMSAEAAKVVMSDMVRAVLAL